MINATQIRKQFLDRFGRAPAAVARAPGRVILIGEHTDYNEGLVLPIACEQATWVACAPCDDEQLHVHNATIDESCIRPAVRAAQTEAPHWSDRVRGILVLLRERGAHLRGAQLLIDSTHPFGAELASSAALEVATALALTHACGEPIDAHELIDLCRAAGRQFAGIPCGLTDHTASLCGRAGSALLLDCRTREIEYVPCELGAYRLLVVNFGARPELAASEYAKRAAECRSAATYFGGTRGSTVRALRDVSSATVRAHAQQLDPLLTARALHVTSEIERTTAAADALRSGDLRALGRLMNESHRSLRDDFEISCRQIERIVRPLQQNPHVLGARMTGAGSDGCVIALVHADAIEDTAKELRTLGAAGGRAPTWFTVRASGGGELA